MVQSSLKFCSDEKEEELERLRNHIDSLLDEQENQKNMPNDHADTVAMLKNRLREKASECSRLKQAIDELRQQSSVRDAQLAEIEVQMKKLVAENQKLKMQIENNSVKLGNGSIKDRAVASLLSPTADSKSPSHSHEKHSQDDNPSQDGYPQQLESPFMRTRLTQSGRSKSTSSTHRTKLTKPGSLLDSPTTFHRGRKSEKSEDLLNTSSTLPRNIHRSPTSPANAGVMKSLLRSQKFNDSSGSDSPVQSRASKSNSEPNLNQHEIKSVTTIGLSSPSTYTMDTQSEYIYRPYRMRNIDDLPFSSWTRDAVLDWLREEGLEEYVRTTADCVKRGEDLARMCSADYELNLGMANPLHRKKLDQAIKAIQSNAPDYAGRLDHFWIRSWLDDLGLPQYKQTFFENRVDGRILIKLTLDDVLYLRIKNVLHHTSLKRAIQFLRHQKFHPQYLKEAANQAEERCDHVMLWSSQRVMTWLRTVDLAEYAPNLRGSGVHGALMVLEPRFNADTLSNLLAIPTTKSLLRRHVAAQFDTLLSEVCQKQKDGVQKTSDFQPLTSTEKHKLRKRGGFGTTLRRRRSETELDSLLCPMELDVSTMFSPPPALDPDILFDLESETESLSSSLNRDSVSTSTTGTTEKVLTEAKADVVNVTPSKSTSSNG